MDDIDTFFDMLNDRFSYLDPSLIDAGVMTHETTGEVKESCRAKFEDPGFQNELKAASPAISAIIGLYKVGVEVNSFQIEELSKC